MNILTFDIEDWWVYENYSIGRVEDYLPRLNGYLDSILDLLDERNVKATFFCLGEVANKYPEVIRKIADKGHHIGSHSFSHHLLGNYTPKDFAADTHMGLDVLENIIGQKVTAYRAPAFSITEKNKWILGVLAENGILYDCSIFPAKRSFGGFSGFEQKTPLVINYQGMTIKEFPISVTRLLNRDIAYSGGGYFRLFPYHTIQSIMTDSDYVMTYFHIKDFDKDQKKRYYSFEGEAALVRYFKKYYGLKGNFSKFKRLVTDFDFMNVKQADELVNWNEGPVITL